MIVINSNWERLRKLIMSATEFTLLRRYLRVPCIQRWIKNGHRIVVVTKKSVVNISKGPSRELTSLSVPDFHPSNIYHAVSRGPLETCLLRELVDAVERVQSVSAAVM
jgi:hypothetical protein